MLAGICLLANLLLTHETLATDFNMDFTCMCSYYDQGVDVGWSGVVFVFAQEPTDMSVTDVYFDHTHNGSDTDSSTFAAGVDRPNVVAPTKNISWISPSYHIYANDKIHCGFSTVQYNVRMNHLYFLERTNPTQIDPEYGIGSCPISPAGVYIVIHTDGKTIEWVNDPPTNSIIPRQNFYLGAGNVEFYKKHQPLRTLNGYTHRHPLKSDKLNLPASPLAPGDSVTLPYDPPKGAKFAVFIYNTDSELCTNRIWTSRSWAEFPLTQPVAATVSK